MNNFAKLGWQHVFTADVEKLEKTFPKEKPLLYKVCTVSSGQSDLLKGRVGGCFHNIDMKYL